MDTPNNALTLAETIATALAVGEMMKKHQHDQNLRVYECWATLFDKLIDANFITPDELNSFRWLAERGA